MAFDFPNAPTVGQKYPPAPVAGVPTYTWDGAKWTTIGVPLGGKTPVYTDGSTPMAAALTLSGSPVNPTDAAAKSYVDTSTSSIAAKVSKSGDTMTGALVAPKIQIGDVDLPSTKPHHLSVYSNTEVSEILVGQQGAYLGIHWQWNVTPANSYAQFDTPSYASPIQIDGSVLALNSLSGGPVTAPTPNQHDNSNKVATTAFVNMSARIAVGVDLNTVILPGSYVCQSGSSNPNEPTGAGQWYLYVNVYNPTFLVQIAINVYDCTALYTRCMINSVWQNWYQFAGNVALFNALASTGMQINGGFEVNQIGLNNTWIGLNTGTPTYILDGWVAFFTSAVAAMHACQSGPGTNLIASPYGLTLQAGAGADFSGVSDIAGVWQPIEGYRFERVMWGNSSQALPITISFWLNCPNAGTFAVSVRNAAANRAYVVDVVHPGGGNWLYYSVTIPGDVTGSWASDNTLGAYVSFVFAAGANWRGTPNVWSPGDVRATPNTTNFFAATLNQITIAGVTILPGSQAPPPSSILLRPYDDELQACRRYLQKIGGDVANDAMLMSNYSPAGGASDVTLTYPVAMRAAPTVSLVGSWTNTNVGALVFNAGKTSLSSAGVATAAGPSNWANPVGSYLRLDARL